MYTRAVFPLQNVRSVAYKYQELLFGHYQMLYQNVINHSPKQGPVNQMFCINIDEF
jgi:hypothetical protein